MKKIVLMGLIIAVAGALVAGVKEAGTTALFKKAVDWTGHGSLKENIALEILNKSKRPIWVAVHHDITIGGHAVAELEQTKVLPYTELTDPMKHGMGDNQFIMTDAKVGSAHLAIYNKRPVKRVYWEKGQFVPKPDEVYEFPEKKTMFITYDGPGKLRPQTGIGLVKGKKTDSGLSLKMNVSTKEIVPVSLEQSVAS